MKEGDSGCDGAVGKNCVGGVEWEWRCWKVERPEASEGGTTTRDHGATIMGDGNGVLVESSLASVVAELTDGDEGAGCKFGEDVCSAGGWRKVGKVELGCVGGLYRVAVGKEGDDAWVGDALVGDGGGRTVDDKMAGSASVGDQRIKVGKGEGCDAGSGRD